MLGRANTDGFGEHHAPFWFVLEGALEGHICNIIDTAKERVFSRKT